MSPSVQSVVFGRNYYKKYFDTSTPGQLKYHLEVLSYKFRTQAGFCRNRFQTLLTNPGSLDADDRLILRAALDIDQKRDGVNQLPLSWENDSKCVTAFENFRKKSPEKMLSDIQTAAASQNWSIKRFEDVLSIKRFYEYGVRVEKALETCAVSTYLQVPLPGDTVK